jgi:hypothetical protein
MINDRKKLYEYLINNNYVLNEENILVYNNLNEFFSKNSVVVIFNEQNILIKDIIGNRKYNFDQFQSTKVIIGFLKYLEKQVKKF